MSDVILGQEALKTLADTIKSIVTLLAEIDNSKEDIKEAIEQLREQVDVPAKDIKDIAKAVYDESYLDKKKGELETLEDMLQALEGKV